MNIGKFYKYVKNKIVSRTSINAIKNDLSDLVVDGNKKVESFNQFRSVFTAVQQ